MDPHQARHVIASGRTGPLDISPTEFDVTKRNLSDLEICDTCGDGCGAPFF